jgi:DNA-binding SARP family transcriptional activator
MSFDGTTIRLLGAAAASDHSHDTRGHPSPPRRLALIALLAIARTTGVSRAHTASLLWRDEDAGRRNGLLTELLAALREELGSASLIERGDAVQLDASRVTIDVAEFETAADASDVERAAAAYAGEFLEGFFLEDAVDFEQWASDQRIRLAKRAAAVFDEAAARAREQGDDRRLIEALQRRAEIEPYAAEPTLRLMLALEVAGDPHAALRAGRTYESRIRTFLETDPAPEVLAETRRLRAIVGPLATPATGNPPAGGEKSGGKR